MHSSLVMLDEPNSALDPLTEEALFTRLSQTLLSACIVASVYRMSLRHHLDTVVPMAEGRVVDVGTVDELLVRQPNFAQMTRQVTRPEAEGSKLAA